jgi:outer membrane protein assembly factor BamA
MCIILNALPPLEESQPVRPMFVILLVLIISLGIVSTGRTADKAKTEPSVGEEKDKKKKKKPKDPNRPAFVGAPIPIVNPTVGWGLGAIAMVNYPLVKSDKISPRSHTAVAGFGSSNKSWAAGVLQQFYFLKDDYRAKLVFGGGKLNSDFYGVGNYAAYEFSFPMGTTGVGGTVSILRRVIDRFYAGIQYRLIWVKNEIELNNLDESAIGDWIRENTDYDTSDLTYKTEKISSGLGWVFLYDSRNDQFSATDGWLAELNTLSYLEQFGSDDVFGIFDAALNGYFSITSDKYVIAARLYGIYATKGTPVYFIPTMGQGADLRGYTFGKYRDNLLMAMQAEFRWNFIWRFYLVAFVGMGTVADGFDDLAGAPVLGSYGGGIRFKVLKKKRLMIRVDYARGAEGGAGALYFSINEAF